LHSCPFPLNFPYPHYIHLAFFSIESLKSPFSQIEKKKNTALQPFPTFPRDKYQKADRSAAEFNIRLNTQPSGYPFPRHFGYPIPSRPVYYPISFIFPTNFPHRSGKEDRHALFLFPFLFF